MIVSIPLSAYNKQYIICLPAVKNNMIEKGLFVRILYSTVNVTFNGIFIKLKNEGIPQFGKVEKDILQAYHTTKNPVYSVEKHLYRNTKTILKISGIWENETNYGLAYKTMD